MKSSTSSSLVSDTFCKFLFGGYATTRKCKAFSSMALYIIMFCFWGFFKKFYRIGNMIAESGFVVAPWFL
jgi:hypothetical protein